MDDRRCKQERGDEGVNPTIVVVMAVAAKWRSLPQIIGVVSGMGVDPTIVEFMLDAEKYVSLTQATCVAINGEREGGAGGGGGGGRSNNCCVDVVRRKGDDLHTNSLHYLQKGCVKI